MGIRNFEELRSKVENGAKKRVAVVAAHDAHTLEAVFKAQEEGVLDYILLGRADEILRIAAKLGHTVRGEDVLDCREDETAVRQGMELIRSGEADFLQKGLLQTSTLLKGVLNKEYGISTGKLISHVALLDIEKYHKIVGVTDGGMLLYPDLEQKKGIVKNAVDMFAGMGYEEPKVAAICAVEVRNPKMPETVDAAELKKAAEAGEFGRCLLEGPISMDLAVNKESARIKGYDSPVCGETDIFLVPNISVGNIMVKSLLEFGNAMMAGCVVGAKCPIALNSRSAAFEEKYYSLMACAQMTGEQPLGNC
ncbi:MAG: phosphate acyltransferase [Blautia sp.]|jgi:phosphate butyryltransferase